MQVRTLAGRVVLVASTSLALGLGGLLVTPAAAAVCDAYSGGCASTQPQDPDDSSITTVDRPRTLPFTGGELVLLTALGAGALAGGTALVVAGRRKPGTAA